MAFIMAAPSILRAQGYEDALRFNQNDLMGTARSQAMGGAFGSLGADLTAMSINPAGMAFYRATEFGLSLGVNVINTESNYWGNKAEDDVVRVPFSQIGIGFNNSFQREEGNGLLSHTFYIGYNRVADYSNKQYYRDPMAYNSLLDYFCTDEQKYASMTGSLAYDAELIFDAETADGGSYSYNVWEDITDDVFNTGFRMDENENGLIDIRRKVKNTGSKGDIAFGYAANISNKVYFGGSISIVTYSFEEKVNHIELFNGTPLYDDDPLYFSYSTTLEQDATGIDFKLGMIYRPINQLRIGFSLASPIFYTVDETYYADIYNPSIYVRKSTPKYDYSYKYRSPSRFVASISGVLGNVGLLSFDYERSNYKRSKYDEKDDDEYDVIESTEDVFGSVNDQMKHEILEAVNTFRVGGELSLLRPFYLRAGYRYSTPGVKDSYYYYKPKNYAISGGVGFRYNNFFADLTYVCSVKEGGQYVLPESDGYIYETTNIPAKFTQKSHNGVITIGFRF